MPLVSSFVVLVQQMGASMTVPTLASLVTVVTGWLYAGRRTVTGIIVAAGAVGLKHHSAYHRVFASAAWSLDGVGLALFGLIRPLLAPGVVALSLDAYSGDGEHPFQLKPSSRSGHGEQSERQRRWDVPSLHLLTSLRQIRVRLADGVSGEPEAVGVVDEPVENGVGQRRVADDGVPVLGLQLGGHHRR
jgi:hypothetical protein